MPETRHRKNKEKKPQVDETIGSENGVEKEKSKKILKVIISFKKFFLSNLTICSFNY